MSGRGYSRGEGTGRARRHRSTRHDNASLSPHSTDHCRKQTPLGPGRWTTPGPRPFPLAPRPVTAHPKSLQSGRMQRGPCVAGESGAD